MWPPLTLNVSDFKRGQLRPITSRDFLDWKPYEMTNSSNSGNFSATSHHPSSEILMHESRCMLLKLLAL